MVVNVCPQDPDFRGTRYASDPTLYTNRLYHKHDINTHVANY